MNEMEKVISEMDFEYFATSQHKMEVDTFLQQDRPVLLDIRATQEKECVRFPMRYFCDVIEIPTDEVPARLGEIPRDRMIGVFCSSGVRCVIIFAYLRSKGYERVRVLPTGYAPLMDAVKPGKIYKKINR